MLASPEEGISIYRSAGLLSTGACRVAAAAKVDVSAVLRTRSGERERERLLTGILPRVPSSSSSLFAREGQQRARVL